MFDICLGIRLDCAAQRVYTEVELSQHDVNHSSLKPFSDSSPAHWLVFENVDMNTGILTPFFITLPAFPDKDHPYGYSYYTNEIK